MTTFSRPLLALCAAALLMQASTLAQPTLDGTVASGEGYIRASKRLNANSGFGTDIGISALFISFDASNLYIGLVGKFNTGSGDGIGLWLNTTSQTGAASNTQLGIAGDTDLHFLNGNDESDAGERSNFRSDAEVDYAFAFRGDNGKVFAAKYVGTPTGAEVGTIVNGATANLTGASVFGAATVQVAWSNAGTVNADTTGGTGLEIKIPFSVFGGTPATSVQLFSFVVSASGYFSNMTVPGNLGGSNLGVNPNFSTQQSGGTDFNNTTPNVAFPAGSTGPYFTTNAALPVELVSFTAAATATGVTLSWKTASEKNNAGFDIERSQDKTAFVKVGFVAGNGTTTEQKSYFFTDKAPAGKVYYRLKQTDFDGKFEYSSTIEADAVAPKTFALGQNYPNPFNPSTVITFSLPVQSPVSLKVYDLTGREVQTLIDGVRAAGNYSVSFNAATVTSGVYFYKLSSNGFSETKKMMLVK